jgi:hypothetical protein
MPPKLFTEESFEYEVLEKQFKLGKVIIDGGLKDTWHGADTHMFQFVIIQPWVAKVAPHGSLKKLIEFIGHDRRIWSFTFDQNFFAPTQFNDPDVLYPVVMNFLPLW